MSFDPKQQIVDDILKELPISSDIEVELPSKCLSYKLPDATKPVTIRPMSFEDEKLLATSRGKTDPIGLILSRCVNNINVNDLFPMDKLYLLLKLREISYGDEYNCSISCPHCSSENKITINLSKLPVASVPDNFEDKMEVDLPVLKKTAVVRLPRAKDEMYLTDLDKIGNNLWRFVEKIDNYEDKVIISKVLEKLPIKDIKTLTNALKIEFGVQTKVSLDCTTCRKASTHELPINPNFFDVN
jgi:hypothetical protein